MTLATASEGLVVPQPAPQHRRNVVLVGTVLAIAAGLMLVGGLLASYFGARRPARTAGETWVDASHWPNMPLAVTYLTLLMSSFTVQWAVSAIKADERRQAYVAFGLTLLLGAAFVNGLTFCWTQLALKAGDGAFADHMYALTVSHLVIVAAAMVLLVVVAFRVLGGQFGPRRAEFVVSAAAFWHFAAAAGVVIWWCVWFLEGGPTS